MEVGIEDCLHIEFEYERGAYHMHDTVLGRIHFLLVSTRGMGAGTQWGGGDQLSNGRQREGGQQRGCCFV